MRPRRIEWDGGDARGLAAELRGGDGGVSIAGEVRELVESVRSGGDRRVVELGAELDGVRVERLEVPADAISAARDQVDPALLEALEVAATNVRAVAEAQIAEEPVVVRAAQGHTVSLREVPVEAAGIYVPGGRAPYPSTVLMGAIPARVAGVERVVVASPPRQGGLPDAAVMAACSLAGVDSVFAMGGAQAIAALAYGTESVEPVDVIAGPGGPWVQEAKLAVSRSVGIDGYAGPSELVVVGDGSVDPEWLALDLCAQAEHGGDGLLVLASSSDAELGNVETACERIAAREPSVGDAALALVATPGLHAAVELAEALAPEHLELCCAGATALAGRIRNAGCVFAGPEAATAFGDYVAGSNHVLPTGGAARFSGPLGPASFRRRTSVVEMSSDAAAELGETTAAIAAAEGFRVHAKSALVRSGGPAGKRS